MCITVEPQPGHAAIGKYRLDFSSIYFIGLKIPSEVKKNHDKVIKPYQVSNK